jgi:Uncharacterized protein conserved in bacteria (DUF2076)
MDANDRRAIEGLFERLAEVERKSPPRDPDAEAFIREQIARQPAARYYRAKTVVVQHRGAGGRGGTDRGTRGTPGQWQLPRRLVRERAPPGRAP